MVEPYQDQSNSVANRVEDLLARLTVEDKAGLMFHDIVAMGPGGQLMGANNSFGRPATDEAIQKKRLNHFNLAGQVNNVRDLVAWHNRVQELALATGPGVPVTVSTDPRTRSATTPALRLWRARSPSGRSRWASPRSVTPTSCSGKGGSRSTQADRSSTTSSRSGPRSRPGPPR